MIGKMDICGFLAVMLISLAGCIAEKDEPEWALGAGDALPRFSVTTIDGVEVSSADSYAAEMVIVFFNTTCQDCRRELPLLQQEYEDDAVLPEGERKRYICISREESVADVERYWAENHLTLPVSAQTDRNIYSRFASSGIPRIFCARDGVITLSLYPAE